MSVCRTEAGSAFVILPRGIVVSAGELRATGLVVAIALFIGFGAVSAIGGTRDNGDEARRASALDVARRQVLALTSAGGASTSGDDAKRRLTGVTKGFHGEFAARLRDLRERLAKMEMTQTGRIVSAGLTSVDKTRAEALVVATSVLRNEQGQAEPTRRYRLTVELTRVRGQWLVSDVGRAS